MVISRSLASAMVWAGAVCHTIANVAVETMRPIQENLAGSKLPGPPSTLLSVSPSRNIPSEVPSCAVALLM